LNRRPFGPQPNALPSCATPRDQRVYGRFGPTGMRTCVRLATRKPRTEVMRPLRAAQTRFRVQLAPKTAAATRQPLSPLPLRVQTGALRSQSATVHRSSPQAEAGAGARAHHLPDRVLRQPSMRGLRRDRSGSSRIRPPPRQAVRHRAVPAVQELADHPGRNCQVRRALRELSPPPHGQTPRFTSRALDRGNVDASSERATGLEPVSFSLEG
jgi:hypothetical protein